MKERNSMIMKVREDGALAIFGTNSYSVIAVYFKCEAPHILVSISKKEENKRKEKKSLRKYLNYLEYVNVSLNLM